MREGCATRGTRAAASWVQLYGLCVQPLMGMTLLALPVAIVGAGLSSALGFIPTYLAYAANGGSYVGAGAAKGATPPAPQAPEGLPKLTRPPARTHVAATTLCLCFTAAVPLPPCRPPLPWPPPRLPQAPPWL